MTERRKTTHEGITHPRFATRTPCKPQKAPGAPAKFSGYRRTNPGFAIRTPCKARNPPSFATRTPCKARNLPSFATRTACKARNDPHFATRTACKARKDPHFATRTACKAQNDPHFATRTACKPEMTLILLLAQRASPKGARGAGQVCRRHRITHPSMLPARSVSPETRRILLFAQRARL